MAAKTRLGPFGHATRRTGTFVREAAEVLAAITGTVTAAITEADIVAGGKTIIITLVGDTWAAAGAAFNAQRQNIIDGLDSAQAEALGWNAEVRDKEVVTAVVRTSDTVVTITLTASPLYDITTQETITVTVPATAVALGNAVVATPAFTVDFVEAVVVQPVSAAGGGIGLPIFPQRRRPVVVIAAEVVGTAAGVEGETRFVALVPEVVPRLVVVAAEVVPLPAAVSGQGVGYSEAADIPLLLRMVA